MYLGKKPFGPVPFGFAVSIVGTPYARLKSKGRLDAPKEWTAEVVAQTQDQPKLKGPCEIEVEFVLPSDKFQRDFPFGGDLDNLLKRLLDALGMTILSEAPGKDGAILRLCASKRCTRPGEQAGARIVVWPLGYDANDWPQSSGLR